MEFRRVLFRSLVIVPDGASAIYGSDAVAGVANIILKRDYQGLETRARSARQLRRAAALGMAMIALGTLASAATMFAATAVPDGRFFFDAFTAVQLGAMLVAASASAIARPAFFAFAGAAAFGGAIGAASWPFALAGILFLALLIVMMREDIRHQRRATRARRQAVTEQQRAMGLLREFERSAEHTSEVQTLMRSACVFICFEQKKYDTISL